MSARGSLLLLAVLLGVACAARPARAQDSRRWTTENTVLALSSTALIVMDWSTTLTMARRPDRYTESNPLLPRHPSVRQVNVACALALGGNLLLAHWLPNPWRSVVMETVTAIELASVTNNVVRYGIGLSLPF